MYEVHKLDRFLIDDAVRGSCGSKSEAEASKMLLQAEPRATNGIEIGLALNKIGFGAKGPDDKKASLF